jgi:hypothetical protein
MQLNLDGQPHVLREGFCFESEMKGARTRPCHQRLATRGLSLGRLPLVSHRTLSYLAFSGSDADFLCIAPNKLLTDSPN